MARPPLVRRPRALVGLLLGVVALALGCLGELGCRRPASSAHRGPIVFITIDALRADALGAFGGPPQLTPVLDGLVHEASWAGRAVSPSSWTVPSMATLFTGVQPWRARSCQTEAAALPPGLETLPQALKKLGFATAGYRSNPWLQERYGYNRGFDTFRYFREGKRAEAELAALGSARNGKAAGPELVWAHILPPHAPYVRHDPLVARLVHPPAELPHRTTVLDLEPYFDPAEPLPSAQAEVFRAMYQLNAAWADQVLGRLMAALRRSGRWDDTLLIVTADHGEEFKECGQVEHGGSLCRALIEVPLIVKLPKGWRGPRLAVQPGERPATARVRATMIEAAGGTAELGTPPSLFHADPGGVLSELYNGNGVNLVSLVAGDRQLVWESRFAPADADFYRARMVQLGGQPKVAPRLSADLIFTRLEDEFGRVPPLAGLPGAPPVLKLWRWVAAPADAPPMTSLTVPIDDPAAAAAMARQLKALWVARNGADTPAGACGAQRQLTEEEAAELRALGYGSGGRAASPTPSPQPRR